MANRTERFVSVVDATGVERKVRRVDAREIAEIAAELAAEAKAEAKAAPKGKGKAADADNE